MGRKSNVVAPTLLIEQDSHATSPSTTPMRPTPLIGSWGDYEWGADYKAAVLAVAAEKVESVALIPEPVATHMIPAYDDDCTSASAAAAPVGFDEEIEQEDDGSITPLPHANTETFAFESSSLQHAAVVLETQCHLSAHSAGEYEAGWYTPEASYTTSQTQSYSEQPVYPAYSHPAAATHMTYGNAASPAAVAEKPRHVTNNPYLAPPQMPHRALQAQHHQLPTAGVTPLRSYVPVQRAQLESVAPPQRDGTAPFHHHQPRHAPSSYNAPRATAPSHATTNYHNRRIASAAVDNAIPAGSVPQRNSGPQLAFAPTQPGEISKFAPPPPPGPETDATFTRNGSPDDAFYTIVMRWYDRVVISQTANGFPPCPPAEQYLHDFPGWLDEVSKWWKTNFANRKGRPRSNMGAMSQAH